ncbi:hypothetical protein C6P40_003721, partial [Pichia californica]
NADLQVRFKWKNKDQKLGTSAIWDNRVSQHRAVWDHEGESERHGTRVTSLSGKPYFDPNSKSQRESLAIFDYKNMQNIIIVARIGNDGILIT